MEGSCPCQESVCLRNTKNTHTNKVVFDVGANIGTVSIPLSRAAQVYSFEPFEMRTRFLNTI